LSRRGDDLRDMAHAAATAAVCEAVRRFGGRRWERAGRGAVDYSVQRELPNGGWPGAHGDEQGNLEAATRRVHAIATAKSLGFQTPSAVFQRARGCFEAQRGGGVRAGRREISGFGERETSKDRLGAAMGPSRLFAGVELFLAWPPSADRRDCLYGYFATLAIEKVGGRPRGQWSRSLRKTIRRTQVLEAGADVGSRDPLKPTKEVRAVVGRGQHGCVHETSCRLGGASSPLASTGRSTLTPFVSRGVQMLETTGRLRAGRPRSRRSRRPSRDGLSAPAEGSPTSRRSHPI
jgi:hypothetical protein